MTPSKSTTSACPHCLRKVPARVFERDGATIVAARAGEMIGEFALAVQRRLTLADLAATIHAYPTWSMAVQQLRLGGRGGRLPREHLRTAGDAPRGLIALTPRAAPGGASPRMPSGLGQSRVGVKPRSAAASRRYAADTLPSLIPPSRPAMSWWASVLGPPETDWRVDFTRAMAPWGIVLEGGDEPLLWVNDRLYGVGRFVDAADAGTERRRRSPCPYFPAPVRGLVEWSEIEPEARGDWVRAWARHGRGLIGRGAVVRSAATLRGLTLLGLTQKWGFDDGDCFLTRDGAALGGYMAAVNDAFQEVMEDARVEGTVGWLETTCHNPFRLCGARETEASSDRLAGLKAFVWVWDDSLPADPELFPACE